MINLLYGEARQNVLTSRYPSTTEDVINLAGLALQSQGDYDTLRHPVGYLSSSDRWHYYVPILLRKSLRVNVWEERILEAYSRNKGKSPILARTRYLEYVRKWAFYGNSFFPCCEFLPPGGYFEMRTQHLLFGVGADGVVLIDQEKHVFKT